MKKAKTILLSFLIVIGTAFMSACSCGSSGGGDAPVIPEKEITISCNEYTGGNVDITYDPESKELDIKCNQGDTFTIEYLLSPDTATTTKVRWEIADKNIVNTHKTSVTEYSKTVKEKVTFSANNKGSTTIKFISETNKTAIANIVVGGRLANLPTLGEVDSNTIVYNGNLGTLSWEDPKKMITSLGVPTDISEEAKADISHYEVVVKNLDTDKSETINVAKNVKKLTILEKGVRYSITIRAIGGSFAAVSGEPSAPFNMCHLESVANLSNNNGSLSFQTPKYSTFHEVYARVGEKKTTPNMAGNTTYTMHCDVFDSYYTAKDFNIYVKSFPALYDEDLGYGRCVNGKGEIVDDLRYYPSNNSNTVNVLKLPDPELLLENYTGTLTINDVTTTATMGTNLVVDKDLKQDYSDYGVFYQLNIKRYTIDGDGEQIVAVTLDPARSKTYDLTSLLWTKLNGGNKFEITVQMQGNKSSTITSLVKKLIVEVPTLLSHSSWGVDGNYLSAQSASRYEGLELYFVDEENDKIVIKTIGRGEDSYAFDLQSLEVDPGNYKLFGRYVGDNVSNGTILGEIIPNPFDNSSGVPIDIDDIDIYIPQGISNFIAYSNGNFEIDKPTSNHNNSIYQLTLTPKASQGAEGGNVALILYNKDDVANKSNYESAFGVGTSNGFTTTGMYGYTLDGAKIKFNLMTAIKDGFNGGDEYFDALFATEYNYTFCTKAYGIKSGITTDGVDSKPTSVSTISRVNSPINISFTNNTLSFASIPHASSYIILASDGENDYEAIALAPMTAVNTMNIDITTTYIKGTRDTLSQVLNNVTMNGNYMISFKAEGVNSNMGGTLYLDSPVNNVYYEVSSILNTIKPTLDLAGNITWTTPYALTSVVSAGGEEPEPSEPAVSETTQYQIADANIQYIIYFYDDKGNNVDHKVFTPVILADGEELAEGKCAVTPQGSVGNEYDRLTVNILSYIKNVLSGDSTICAIEIKEYNKNKLMGAGTIKYYVATLDQTVPTTFVDGNTNVITWDAIDGADSYDIFVNDSNTPAKSGHILNSINVSELCTNIGVYTIRVMAKADNASDVGSSDNPFYIYGNEGVVDVNIISAIIQASVNNIAVSTLSSFDEDFITWTNICTKGTYYSIKINGHEFKLTPDQNGNAVVFVPVDGDDTIVQQPFTTSTVKVILTDDMYKKLIAGDNSIVIEPTIDFATTGYILVDKDSLLTNTINKVATPAFTTFDGAIVTTVNGEIVVTTDAGVEHLVVQIKTTKEGDTFKQLSLGSDYTIKSDKTNDKIKTIIINSAEEGELYIQIKAVKKDAIYSDYLVYLVDHDSDPNTPDVEQTITKLNKVPNFSRNSDGWFVWNAVEGVTSYELVVYKTVLETVVPIPPEGSEEGGEQGGEQGVSETQEGGEAPAEPTDPPIIEDDDTQNNQTSKIIKFTVVKTADGYNCSVDDGVGTAGRFIFVKDATNGDKFKYIFDEQVLFNGKGSGDYHFTIRPLTTTNGYLNGGNSTETIITKLNNIADIKIDGGLIVISGYNQTGNGVPTGIAYEITPYTESKTESGTVTLTNPTPEGGSDPEAGVTEETPAPTTPTIITGVVATGEVNWNDDFENNKVVTIDLLKVVDASGNKVYSDYDLSHYNFKIKIKYLGDTDGKKSVNSDWSDEVSLERYAPSKLSTVDGVVAIQPVEGATNYKVEITATGDEPKYVTIPASDGYTLMTELVASAQGFTFTANKEYILRVQTLGGKLNSAWSEEFTVIKLGAPIEPIEDKGIYIDSTTGGIPRLNWENNTNNTYHSEYSYRMIFTVMIGDDMYSQIEGVNGKDFIDISKGATAQEIPTNMPVGTYYIRLRTQGTSSNDGLVGYLNSDYTTGIPVTYVSETSGLKVSEGIVSWNAVSSAVYYIVRFEYLDAKGDKKYTSITTNQTFISTEQIPNDVAQIVDITVTTFANPAVGIISTYKATPDEVYTANQIKVYKPSTPTDYKVIDGMLTWTIDLKDILNFVESQNITLPEAENPPATEPEDPEAGVEEEGADDEPEVVPPPTTDEVATEIVKHVFKKIKYNMKDDSKKDFELQFNHLLQARLKMNEKTHIISPTNIELIAPTGDVIGGVVDSAFEDDYWLGGYKIRYYYDVVTDRYNENVLTNPESPIGYISGNYTLQLSLLGNSSDAVGSSTPVLNSSYTSQKDVYKLLSPNTWTREADGVKYDIESGNIYWTLVNNGIDNNYYTDYAISAYSRELGDTYIAYITIDTSSEYMVSENMYYQHISQLFTVDSLIKENPNNAINDAGKNKPVLTSDTKYQIRVYASGTRNEVSGLPKIYLNSNSLDYINSLSILDTPGAPSMDSNNVVWNTAVTSSYTRVKIYGPFTSTATDNYQIDASEIADMTWSEGITEATLAAIDQAAAVKDSTVKPAEVIDFGVTPDGGRINVYTLTNKYLDNNPKYATGGYIFTFQEIGDERGVIDSGVSELYSYYKLGQTTKVEMGTGKYNGMFVWDGVEYANAYKVQLYKVGRLVGQQKEDDELISVRYTNQTFVEGQDPNTKTRYFYDLPDFEYDIYDEFYILVQACNIANTGIEFLNVENNLSVISHLKDGWFMGDDVKSTIHTRLAAPTSFDVARSGLISWNEIQNAGSYTVIYNDGVETVDGIVVNSHTILKDIQGHFTIKVRTIVDTDDNKIYLNSRHTYSTPLMKLMAPEPQVINGNIQWGVAGQTGNDANFYSQLIIDCNDDANKIIVNGNTAVKDHTVYDIELNGLTLQYFTDITTISTEYNPVQGEGQELPETPEDILLEYTYNGDLVKYPVGVENFSMQYIGNMTSIQIKEGEGNTFMISSTIKYIDTYKLPAPTDINFAEIDLSGETVPVNRLYWSPVDNATDYNIFAFASKTDGAGSTTYTKQLIKNVTTNAGAYRFADGKCYYDITEVLQGGATNYFFVQAVGGTIDGTHYISSSYSDRKIINVPITPKNLTITNGQMNWEVDTNNNYNMGLVLEYTVSNVTNYDTYWKLTAASYEGADKIALNDTIKSRTMNYDATTQTLSVVESILLEYNAVDDEGKYIYGNSTPYFYKLNAIAKYTKFKLFALSGTNINNPTFKSKDLIRENPYDFTLFASGDGTTQNAYIITSETYLKNIQYFKERAFKLNPVEVGGVKKITLTTSWATILGDFKGSIDGNNTIIDSYQMQFTKVNNTKYVMGFVENNKGTIKDITFNMQSVGLVAQQSDIRVATVAVTNSGTIENVDVIGVTTYNSTNYNLYVETKDATEYGVKVGGLVVENSGILRNITVDLNIYAISVDTIPMRVGGIAYKSTGGTISYCTFMGDIIGNYIGGIVYEANNVSKIEYCNVGSESEISTFTGQAFYGDYGKGVQVGGLVGMAVATSNAIAITNCNTYVNIKLNVKSGANRSVYYLGGMIGLIYEDNTKNINVSSSYTSVAYEYIGTQDMNTITNYIQAYIFAPTNRITCTNCKYTNRTTGSFILSNNLPQGVTKK